MPVEQCDLLVAGCFVHALHQFEMDVLDREEWPLGIGPLRDPWRMLDDIAEHADELIAAQIVQVRDRHRLIIAPRIHRVASSKVDV